MNPLVFVMLSCMVQDPVPALWERDRFPSREMCREAMAFNRAFVHHLEGKMLIEEWRWEYYREAIQETNKFFHCYDWLHAAQGGEGRDEQYWRHSLWVLREHIDWEAFYAGTMPPTVPFRYFSFD